MSEEEQKPEEATFMDGAPEAAEAKEVDTTKPEAAAELAQAQTMEVETKSEPVMREHTQVVFHLAVGQTCLANIVRVNDDKTLDLSLLPLAEHQPYLPHQERGREAILRLSCPAGEEVGSWQLQA